MRKAITKAYNRFWEWFMYISVTRYNYPDRKAAMYRYPSPGSSVHTEPVLNDYREPFSTSIYNIRYRKETPQQKEPYMSLFEADALHPTTIEEKLIDYGYLKRGQEANKELVDKAKLDYAKKYGFPVETKVYHNDFKYKMPQHNNPESYRYATELSFKVAQSTIQAQPTDIYDDVYNSQLIWIESLDMFAGDPEYQQREIELEYMLDGWCKDNQKKGHLDIWRGNRHFWKAMDDLNQPENVVAVQTHINDPNPDDFTLKDWPIELKKDKKGNVVDVLP